MLLLTAYCLQMTAEMCIPHLSSDRINSNAVFHVCFDNVWMLSTTHGMLSGCQVWLKNLLKTPTVKKNLKNLTKEKQIKAREASPSYLQQGSMDAVVSHTASGRVWEPPQQGQHRVWNFIGQNKGNQGPARHLPAAVHGGVPTPGKGRYTMLFVSQQPTGLLKRAPRITRAMKIKTRFSQIQYKAFSVVKGK